MRRALPALLLWLVAAPAQAQGCDANGVQLQVLGSGGPELIDRRASSSYLIWLNGKARVLIDLGGGAALRFNEAGARAEDLDAILLTHLHVDHSADLPALVKASWFGRRIEPLEIYGPHGNNLMPSTVTFVRTLFDKTRGAYRYLGDFLSPLDKTTYKLRPHDVPVKGNPPVAVFKLEHGRAQAATVTHGAFPALAWRVEMGGKSVVFSGDTNGDGDQLERLAKGADLLVAHNAVPEGAVGVERGLHMPPSVIGLIAHAAHVKQLVLSHRMARTLGKEDETLAAIKKKYEGPLAFANDLDCFKP
ncbi:MAG: MBL fold metallo-hydrolase [Gammaproteobacteria bacterium]|nr:MBL fold metallo-hydrolase [Gammaproteobacteria bacterium]